MPNSGAFRSLHCLIYKVLAAAFSVAEHLLSYHTFLSLSSTFFDFFQNLFRTRSLVFGLARKLDYFTTLSWACQALFSTFFKIFFRAARPSSVFAWELSYFITLPRVCQVLFSFFSDIFSLDLARRSSWLTACILYQILYLLSRAFFKNFWNYFTF